MLERIRDKFGSVSALARHLGVSRNAVYLALNGNSGMKKLRVRILKALRDSK